MNLKCLVELIAGGHDYQDIHVAVCMRPTIRVRTEENDFFRFELLCNVEGEPANLGLRNVRSSIPASLLQVSSILLRIAHTLIVAQNGRTCDIANRAETFTQKNPESTHSPASARSGQNR